ncbi:methylmalonyl-CoA mutase family protein, partial [Pseudomonas aeruginosa]
METGYIQKEIQESAYAYHQQVESKERIIVGVNEFIDKEREDIPLLRVD